MNTVGNHTLWQVNLWLEIYKDAPNVSCIMDSEILDPFLYPVTFYYLRPEISVDIC